ncbi:unnamed protein product [Linum trigynum]|uniref:Gnk2-homologous domain-containing protein n=1 Tax=Linum trigynum TaxID=586398 RepID=A0AAV2EIQ1_9ROSI
MAKSHISLAMKSAVVVLMIAAAYFVTVSGKDDDDTKFCGCGSAKDQKNFPARLGSALDDVVKNTASSQRKDQVSGDITYTATDPKKGGTGAAAVTGTCFGGAALANCSSCLSKARGFLDGCGVFACGGLRFEGKCRLQFRQLK